MELTRVVIDGYVEGATCCLTKTRPSPRTPLFIEGSLYEGESLPLHSRGRASSPIIRGVL